MGGQRGQGEIGDFQASQEAVGGIVGVKLAVYSTRADPTDEGKPMVRSCSLCCVMFRNGRFLDCAGFLDFRVRKSTR